jgi:lambda repressor-like predicted transcriptional regulator
MDPIDINYQLKKKKSSQAAIAKKLKVNRSTVCDIIHGRQKSKRIMKAIAKVIGKEVKDIWPNAA